uniref:Uncharacterized protein n=1 Tax=Arundo donax TaxID=35708 RepID=A0A0A8ZBU1_ARUDO
MTPKLKTSAFVVTRPVTTYKMFISSSQTLRVADMNLSTHTSQNAAWLKLSIRTRQ